MALGAGGGIEIGCMAVAATGIFMIEAGTVTAARVGQVEAGRTPGTGVMALVTAHTAEETGVEGWLGVTRRASA